MAAVRLRLCVLLALAVAVASGVQLTSLKVVQCNPSAKYAVTLHGVSAHFKGDRNNTLVVTGGATVSHDLDAPLHLEVTMRAAPALTGFQPLTIPCTNGIFGSCTYQDACSLASTMNDAIPSACNLLEKLGLPCQCPIPEGEYSIPKSELPLGPMVNRLPGVYGLQLNASHVGRPVTCYQISFILQ